MLNTLITRQVSFPELLFLTAEAAARDRNTNAFRRMRKILRDTVKRHALDKGYANRDCPQCRGLAVPWEYLTLVVPEEAVFLDDTMPWICLEHGGGFRVQGEPWTEDNAPPQIYGSRETRQDETPRWVLANQIWTNLRKLYGPDVEQDADSAFQKFLAEETEEA